MANPSTAILVLHLYVERFFSSYFVEIWEAEGADIRCYGLYYSDEEVEGREECGVEVYGIN